MKSLTISLQEGHLSSNGECFDVGKTVGRAIYSFERSNQKLPYPGSTAEGAAGNGSLMRLCPVPLVYYKHPSVAMEMSKESSRTTHGPNAALDACRFVTVNFTIVNAHHQVLLF